MQLAFFSFNQNLFYFSEPKYELCCLPPAPPRLQVCGPRSPLLTEQLMKVEPIPAQPVKSDCQPAAMWFLSWM